jgi:UDP-glucose 4-epimerase
MMTSSKRTTVLITGGSGFIGRNLVERFTGAYDVRAPSPEELDLIDDEAVRTYFQDNKIDYVVHCATKPGHRNAADPTNLVYFNSLMFFNVARNSERFKKMIFIGSGAEYDMRHYQPKMPETYFDTHVPADEHGLSKYIVSKYIEGAPNIVNLRIFGIFGKHEDYAIRFISNAICKTLFDLPITLRQNRRFDYLYVSDLPGVIEHFIRKETSEWAYNVTPDDSIELLTLANMVKKVSGKDLPVIVGQEGLGVEYSGDNARLRSEIPDLKFTPVDQAISELYKWYSDNKHLIDKASLMVDK